MKFKRILTVFAAAALTAGASACGAQTPVEQAPAQTAAQTGTQAPAQTSEQTQAPANNESVTLKVLYSGPGSMPDTQKVIGAFNAELGKYMSGVTADIEFVLSANYEERLRLMLSAGETVDVADLHSGTAEATNTVLSEARKGAMLPLDDMLAKKPDFFTLIPDSLWQMSRVADVTYMVPINNTITDRFVGINMPADMADKYMDMSKLRELLGKDNGSVTQEVYDLITDYLTKAAADGDVRRGISPATMRWLPERAFYSLLDKAFVVRKEGTGVKVENYFATEDAKNYFRMQHEWWNAGYVDQEVLSADDRRFWERKPDGSAIFMAGHKITDPNYTGVQWDSESENSENWGMEVRSVPWEKNIFIAPVGNTVNGLFIPRTSKHPEQALEYIWLTNSNIELLQFLSDGLEGEHYTRDADGTKETLIKEADQAKYRGEVWNIGNMLLPDPKSKTGNDWITYNNDVVMGSMAITTPLASFQLDIAPVKNEVEQFQAVRGEYEWALDCGAVDNWESYYNDMITKMNAAGAEKILTEIQRQVDEYMANK